MHHTRLAAARRLGLITAAAATLVAIPQATLAASPGRTLPPQPAIHAMATIHDARVPLSSNGDCVLPVIIAVTCVGVGTPMTYGGGRIETSPRVFIVFWGWHSDPSGQAAYQKNFFKGLGGSAWNASQTQYCNRTTDPVGLLCAAGAAHVGNPSGLLAGTWTDTTYPVPLQPGDAAIRTEAARAAAHFGHTTAASNVNAQYVIDTPEGNSTSGFGTQWCAYHGAAATSYGTLSYTDFPYITDAGASCGENFVNSGSAGRLDGVSIVGGHEFAESETDVNPPSAWTDTAGAETGDKCAWIQLGPGAAGDVTLSTGRFAVQSLWSNAANHHAGGCVI